VALQRLGDLLYGGASVAREGWVAWAGTEVGLYPIVTLEKQLPNMIGKLV
jgi:hypothetical protein